VPEPQHSQHEHPSAPTKSCTPSPLSEPDQIWMDTEHGTGSRLLVVGVEHVPRS
jgi:hypothetical protein